MRGLAGRWPVTTYVVLACAFTWAWDLPVLLRGEVIRSGVGWPTHVPSLLGPALAAIAVTVAVDGRRGLRELVGRMLRWWVPLRIWALVAASTLGVGALAALATGGLDVGGLGRFSGFPASSPLLALLALVVVNGFGEETGWRGFAHDRLRQRHGTVVTSLLVALPWMLWHLPLFWILVSFRDLGAVGLPGFLVGMVAGAIVLGWLYEHSGRSVAVVAVWHGLYNWMVATDVGGGAVPGMVTAVVMVAAGAIIWGERRTRRPLDESAHRPPALAGGSR